MSALDALVLLTFFALVFALGAFITPAAKAPEPDPSEDDGDWLSEGNVRP